MLRILHQIKNDRRSIGLLIVAPIFILTLLYFLLGTTDYTPTIAVYNLPEPAITSLSESLQVTEITEPAGDTEESVYKYIAEQKLDAYLITDTSGMHVYMKEADTKTAQVRKALSSLANGAMTPDIQYQYETDSDNQLDSLAFVFLGVLAFFFVFIFSGVSFVGERSTQTLDRMMLSPLSRFSIIGGYLLGYGILSAMQSTLIILFAKYILRLNFNGSLGLCILVMVLLSFCAVSFGTLLSLFAKNQFQMIQFIPIIIVPQIFFSGLIPLDTIPYGIGKLCYVFPAYYGCFALKEVMIYGYDFVQILSYLAGLLGFTGVLFLLNVFALKRAS